MKYGLQRWADIRFEKRKKKDIVSKKVRKDQVLMLTFSITK